MNDEPGWTQKAAQSLGVNRAPAEGPKSAAVAVLPF